MFKATHLFSEIPPPTLPSQVQNVTDSPNQQFFSVSTSSDPANGVQLKISVTQSQNQSQYQSGHQLLANYILKLLLDRKLNQSNAPSGGGSTSTTLPTTLAPSSTTQCISYQEKSKPSHFTLTKFRL